MINNSSFNIHIAFAQYFNDKKLEPFLFMLSKKMEDGHICFDINTIDENSEFWLEYNDKPKFPILFNEESEFVGSISDVSKPFILHNNLLYTGRNFCYETLIIEHLQRLSDLNPNELQLRIQALMEKKPFVQKLHTSSITDDDGNSFPDWQFYASLSGFMNNVTIITGGPGTGKTTTVAKILAILNAIQPDFKLALAAPTGKAAMRMKESLLNTVNKKRNAHLEINKVVESVEPSTIHRLLGSNKNSLFFKYNDENQLDLDVIIIDESSMIGVGLFAKLLSAIKDGTRLIILGDSDQLASVEAGSLFGDICKGLIDNENKFSEERFNFFKSLSTGNNSLDEKVIFKKRNSFLDECLIRLKKTYRYEQASKLGQFTKAVIQGKVDDLEDIIAIANDSLIVDETYSESKFSSFVEAYDSYLKESDIELALKKINNLRVLCAVREGEQGVYAINAKIEKMLKKKCGLQPSEGFYHNQPIMVKKNTPALNLFNGDIGIIRLDENKKLKAYFQRDTDKDKGENKGSISQISSINPALISDWETVFAMTIHKSQGSEFDEVLVVLPKNENIRLLTRELLYTAVTRAKKKAIVQSGLETIKSTVNRGVERVSGVKQRINII